MEERYARAVAVAKEVVGLDIAAARARAAREPDLVAEFVAEGAPITADLRRDRIRRFVRDGVIVDAHAG